MVYYPGDLTSTVTWHDGSPFSAADVVLHIILTFDRAKEASAVYDESAVPAFNTFMEDFKGLRILSVDPLVIETYRDDYQIDAERMVDTWWPCYSTGPGAWHNLDLGLLAEAAGEAAFSDDKADALQVEWLDYIDGPSLAILEGQLNQALAEDHIPYSPTLGQYITTTQASARWQQLAQWWNERGHFWIGTGPFYLEEAQPSSGTLTLQRYAAHPDPLDRWAAFGAAPIAEVEIAGPEDVLSGTAATFDVQVSFEGQPYTITDTRFVRYLVIDAQGDLALSGEAAALGDGQWQIVLDEGQTGQLPAGPTRLEVIVTPGKVVLPTFAAHPFSVSVHAPMTPGGGGTLVYTDTQGTVTSIEVPAGAVAQTITLAYAPVQELLAPEGYRWAGLAFDLKAYLSDTLQPGFQFATPVTLSAVYSEGLVLGETNLLFLYWDEIAEAWIDAAETCDPASGYLRSPEEDRLSVPICHLSQFALLEPVEQIFLPLVVR
ncbi:MAG: hypothetical protein JXA37_07910 [Chloroflexia bacterium]|nr:hypothetical protein [Chloroflexia bacterium]